MKTKEEEQVLIDYDERKRLTMEAGERLWDTIKTPVLQSFFDNEVTRIQVGTAKKLFMDGFDRACSGDADTMQCEQFRWEVIGNSVMMVVVFGKDEWKGTMASILCKTRGSFFIRQRGRVTANNYDKGQKTKAQRHPGIYGWTH